MFSDCVEALLRDATNLRSSGSTACASRRGPCARIHRLPWSSKANCRFSTGVANPFVQTRTQRYGVFELFERFKSIGFIQQSVSRQIETLRVGRIEARFAGVGQKLSAFVVGHRERRGCAGVSLLLS